ncbi:MAG TPA: hypothetical protein VL358_10345 [Caulobacteraceae bacterium]|jgi:hypothetical protein|nr:hypothetical protein [Caulobacteraceae bacterium]
MELDGYDVARFLGLTEPVDPREWRIEDVGAGAYRAVREADGKEVIIHPSRDQRHAAALRFMRRNG